MDATCYQSEVRYSAIQKLLWESVHWLYNQLRKTCSILGIKMVRSSYNKWKKGVKGKTLATVKNTRFSGNL